MGKIKIINKGYTLEVTSWENDGDNYNTKKMVVDSKELAIALLNLCKTIFVSKNREKTGIGNSMDANRCKNLIVNYMKENPILYADETIRDDDHLVDLCMELNYNLLGSSEFYYSRVFESAKLFYSEEDIYLDEVEI